MTNRRVEESNFVHVEEFNDTEGGSALALYLHFHRR